MDDKRNRPQGGVGGCQKFFVGYGAVVLVTTVLLGLCYLFLWPSALAKRYRHYLVTSAESFQLEEPVERRTVAAIDGFLNRLAECQVSDEEMETLLEMLERSSLSAAFDLLALSRLVSLSGLSDEKKKLAGKNLRRLASGLLAQRISPEEIAPSFDAIPAGHAMSFLSDADLSEALRRIGELLDARGIEREEALGDVAAEVERILGGVARDRDQRSEVGGQ